MGKIIAAVEVGTAKVVVLIGEVTGGTLNIVSHGWATSNGVKKGEIVDFRAASEAVQAAIMHAERKGGVSIGEVYLAMTGAHLEGMHVRGAVNVSAASGIVSETDQQRAVTQAKNKQLPAGRVYLAYINCGWRLDGRPVEQPRGHTGEELEVNYWNVHADERKLAASLRLITQFDLPVKDVILGSLAAASVVAEEQDKRNGCLVIDFGAGTTDWALYHKGWVVKTGVVRAGGAHITNDLSLGLRVQAKHAEKIKTEFGRAVADPATKGDRVWMIGEKTIGDRQLPRGAIDTIVHARVDEILGIIQAECGDALNPSDVAAGVILTGGASRLALLAEATQRRLGLPARLGQIPAWVADDLRGPEYATVLGLLYFGLTAQAQPAQAPAKPSLFKKLTKLFALK